MPTFISRTAKLLPYAKRPRSIAGYATSYHFEPEAEQALKFGNLIIVAEILTNPKQGEDIAEIIIRTAGEAYYETGTAETAPERFEAAVKRVNHELSEYTNRGNAGWVGRASALIAVVADGSLHLTQTGSAEAFLSRSGSFAHITANLGGKGPHRPISTFGNIASGSLKVGDKLLLTTPALLHYMARAELRALLADNSPNSAVAKISEILGHEPGADRTAATITEITTPELMANQFVSSEPDEVRVGEPENVLDAAKMGAAPLVDQTIARSREAAAWVSQTHRDNFAPKLRQGALVAAAASRRALSHRHATKILAALAVLLVVGIFATFTQASRHASIVALEKRFDAAVADEEHAKQRLQLGDKDGASKAIATSQTALVKLQKDSHAAALEKALAARKHDDTKPATLALLQASLESLAGLADGVTTVATTKICSIASLNPKPTKAVFAGGRLVMAANNMLATCDPTTGKTSTVSQVSFGSLVDLSPSTSGDAVFILTSEPSVWLYRPADGSLVRQTASGGWTKGAAIASYNSNVYILAADSSQIYKFVPVLSGYSVKSPYLISDTASLAGSTALTIDGSVYAMGGSGGLKRYLAGKLDQQLTDVPNTLLKPGTLQSINDGASLLDFDRASGRIGVFSTPEAGISYGKQYKLKGAAMVTGSADPKSNNIYAVTSDSVVKFPIQ